jgi:DNA-binding MarR family transcriptional regulator
MTIITENERKVLNAIRFNYFGSASGPGYAVWSLQIDDSNRSSGLTPRTLSGVCGSLAKKGLVKTSGSGRQSCIELTQTGFEAIKED